MRTKLKMMTAIAAIVFAVGLLPSLAYAADDLAIGTQANPVNISNATIATVSAQTYTGSAIQPTPTVTYNGKTLTRNTDYRLTYSNNTNAGTATITATGIGNYTGTKTRTFTINPVNISTSSNVSVGTISSQTYTGSAITPTAPTITYRYSSSTSTRTLVRDTDFTISYTNNTNAGTATATITGKGNYTGTVTRTFTINPAYISSATIGSISAQTYTGSALTPVPRITYRYSNSTITNTLVKNTDFTVEYMNNTNAGTAYYTVTGKGNYTGSTSYDSSYNRLSFTINKAALSSTSISYIMPLTYNRTAQTPTPMVMFNGNVVDSKEYTVSYSNNTAAGQASVTVTAASTGNFTGSNSRTFTINKANIGDATISNVTNRVYNGREQTQTPKVAFGSYVMVEGRDYDVFYSKNLDAGTATLIVNGKGSCEGSKTVTFTIAQVDMSSVTVSSISSKRYTGSYIEPAPVLKLSNGEVLARGVDYTVTYRNNLMPGTASIVLTGKGVNVKGTRTVTFKITPRSVASAKISGVKNEVYTGNPIKPEPVVKFGKDLLTRGTDYSVRYSNCTNAGTAQITITGKGGYTGTQVKKFTIKPASIKDAKVTLKQTKYVYDGKEHRALASVMMGEKKLKEGTGFRVAYLNGTKSIGRHRVVITGKGNYTGTASAKKEFSIYLQPTKLVKAGVYSYPESPTTAGIQVMFNKVSSKYCDGYRIELSRYSNFKALEGHKEFGVTSSYGASGQYRYGTLKQGVRYYIHVRTYKTFGGKNVYSDPSPAIAITSATTKRVYA